MNDYTPNNIVKDTQNSESKKNNFFMIFDKNTDMDGNLSLLKEKHKTYAKILKSSEIQRAQSVKILAKRLIDKQKQEEDMKNIRILPMSKNKPKKVISRDLNFTVLFNSRAEPTEIECNWSRIIVNGWIPESRESASLVGYNKNLYLIGGLSRSILNQVLILSPLSLKWSKYENFVHKFDPIYAHSCLLYENQFLLYGGISDYNDVTRKRECLNFLRTLNPEIMEINYINTHGVIFEFRKYHSAVIFGKHLLVYGGLNSKNSILDSCLALNLVKKSWRNIETTGNRPFELAGHGACAVYNSELCPSLFSSGKRSAEFKHQGIYFFGGYNKEYKALGTLYLLKPGKMPLNWTLPLTSGLGPSPRYYHSMLWIKNINSLVIYGGRNDQIGASYADIHILKLESLLWLKVINTGNIPSARSSHCAAELEGRMFVFGGVSFGKFCKSEMISAKFSFSQLCKRKKFYIP